MRFGILAALFVACTAPVEVPVAPSEVTTDDGLYVLQFATDGTWATGETARLHVDVWYGADPVVDSTLAVTPFMPDMGHGLAADVEVVPDGLGGHDASWSFTMPGYWELSYAVDGVAGPDTAVVGYEVP